MLTPKTTQPRPSPAFEEVSCQGFDLFCSLTRRQLPETVPVRKVYGLPRASFSRNLAVQVLPLAMCLAPPPALRDFHPVEFAHAERTKKGLLQKSVESRLSTALFVSEDFKLEKTITR